MCQVLERDIVVSQTVGMTPGRSENVFFDSSRLRLVSIPKTMYALTLSCDSSTKMAGPEQLSEKCPSLAVLSLLSCPTLCLRY